MMKLESHAGQHISAVCAKAVEMTETYKEPVEFEFNELKVIVKVGETAEAVQARWAKEIEERHQKYINSQEYKDAETKRAKEYADRCVAVLTEKAQSEAELRDTPDPHPYTALQLAEYVESLVNRQHGYGTCVYAMTLAATAAFNYVAHKLGVTGFQASCADLAFLKRSRSIEGPFMIIKAEDALYPQSDPRKKLDEALAEWEPWMKKEAENKLRETNGRAHNAVVSHWRKLAGVALVFVLLLLSPAARADSVTNLAGTLTGIPNEVLTYNFTVDTSFHTDFGGYVEDILNGTALISSTSGQLLSTFNYISDYYIFGLTETSILAEYGIYSSSSDPYGPPPVLIDGYDFVASASGISIVFTDPPVVNASFAGDPVATPEPMTIVLLFVGGIYLWALSVKPRKIANRPREYPANHLFGK